MDITFDSPVNTKSTKPRSVRFVLLVVLQPDVKCTCLISLWYFSSLLALSLYIMKYLLIASPPPQPLRNSMLYGPLRVSVTDCTYACHKMRRVMLALYHLVLKVHVLLDTNIYMILKTRMHISDIFFRGAEGKMSGGKNLITFRCIIFHYNYLYQDY